jgi:hypothetical protein
MPNILTNVNAFTNPVVAPASGDPVSSAGIAAAVQPLTNRTYYLLKQLGGDVASPDPRDAANGFAGLDSSAKVPFARLRNGLVLIQQVANVALMNLTSTSSFVDVPGMTVTMPGCLVGDLLIVLASASFLNTSLDESDVKFVANQNGGSFSDIPGALMVGPGSGDAAGACVAYQAITTAGDCIVKGQGMSPGGHGRLLATNSLIVLQIRP